VVSLLVWIGPLSSTATRGLAELFLTETEHLSAQPQPRSDPDVDRVRCFDFRTARPPGRLQSCHVR
jgi:hypothetical protein